MSGQRDTQVERERIPRQIFANLIDKRSIKDRFPREEYYRVFDPEKRGRYFTRSASSNLSSSTVPVLLFDASSSLRLKSGIYGNCDKIRVVGTHPKAALSEFDHWSERNLRMPPPTTGFVSHGGDGTLNILTAQFAYKSTRDRYAEFAYYNNNQSGRCVDFHFIHFLCHPPPPPLLHVLVIFHASPDLWPIPCRGVMYLGGEE